MFKIWQSLDLHSTEMADVVGIARNGLALACRKLRKRISYFWRLKGLKTRPVRASALQRLLCVVVVTSPVDSKAKEEATDWASESRTAAVETFPWSIDAGKRVDFGFASTTPMASVSVPR